MENLRIAINAQVMPDAAYGGIVTVLRVLATLPGLDDGTEEYVFIGPYDDPEWMRRFLPVGQRIVRGPKSMSPVVPYIDRLEPLKRRLGSLRPMAREIKQMIATQVRNNAGAIALESKAGQPFAPSPPRSFFQSLGCHVVHFPFQSYEECGLPSVYNPHDLQHLHLPQFFTTKEISRRERLYPMACRAAHTVVVASEMVKRDVEERYGIPANKVQVIPWAPPSFRLPGELAAEELTRMVHEKYQLTGVPFVLYPAMTWEHKNHIRVLEAVASLRDQGDWGLRLICTGYKTGFWPSIEKRLRELNLQDAVIFPGLVTTEELSVLYRCAQFVFVPTLFEAASAPVFEAWQHGTPVACSTVTSLPEQVADAALLFDPFSVDAIANTLKRMTNESALREDLRRRGMRRLRDFSLERTAKAYRAVYRRAAGRELSDEDRELLRTAETLESRREFEVSVGG